MSLIVLIITTLSHKLYKHSKVPYICGISLLLVYTSKRYQKDCGWPLEYKSLSIYISHFLLTLFYLFLLFHKTLSTWVSIQFWKGSRCSSNIKDYLCSSLNSLCRTLQNLNFLPLISRARITCHGLLMLRFT